MKSLIRFIFACFLLLPAFVFVEAQSAPLNGFDAYVEKALKDWEVPGVAIAVVKDDKIVFAKGYGLKELGNPEKVNERTIFGVASNSKAFTSAALAILVDEGKLGWDDKVITYLPEFQLYDSYVTREITIRDLLTHRSGLPAYGGDILWWGGDYSRDEIIHRVRFVKPQSSFRSRYAYQNIPFITAGKIVERVSGKTWEEFVKERIFTPLGMKDTTTSIKDFTPATNKVTPHFRDIETGKTIPIAWRNLDNGAPAAGINSNVVDMAQWVRLQLNGGKFDGKQIISESSLAAMHTPQIVIPFSNPKDQPRLKTNFAAYGLGWNIREYAGYKMISHGGWTDGQLTFTAMLPEKELGVLVLTNIHNRNLYTPLVYRIFDAFINESFVKKNETEKPVQVSIDLAPLLKINKDLLAEAKSRRDRLVQTNPKSRLLSYLEQKIANLEREVDVGEMFIKERNEIYIDGYFNWSAYYLKRTQDAETSEIDANRKKETERVKDAKPVLPLFGYAGIYENELYGKISFAEENGKLVVRMSRSPTFIGDLEHWHFNTFRVIWRDPVAEKTFLTFIINEQGKAASVKMALDDFIDDAEYEYFRTEK